jgi:pimeloyl-ACP methyl ester carboxylesterase
MRPLLLLHGALGATSQLDPLKLSLENSGYTVFSMNFSGHGGEPFRKAFGIRAFADEVLEFLDANKLQKVDIFGYSMGGYVALWLALQHPNRIGSIATLGTKFDWTVTTAEREVRKLDPEKVKLKVPVFAKVLQHRHAPNNWEELMKKTAAMMLDLGKNPLLPDDIFCRIKNETFIMLGDEDDTADMVCTAKINELLPHARFLLLENTPHQIEKVDVNRLARLTGDFFRMKMEAPVRPL